VCSEDPSWSGSHDDGREGARNHLALRRSVVGKSGSRCPAILCYVAASRPSEEVLHWKGRRRYRVRDTVTVDGGGRADVGVTQNVATSSIETPLYESRDAAEWGSSWGCHLPSPARWVSRAKLRCRLLRSTGVPRFVAKTSPVGPPLPGYETFLGLPSAAAAQGVDDCGR